MTALPKPPVAPPPDLARLEDEAGVEFVNGRMVEKPVSVESNRIEVKIIRLLGNEAARTGSADVFGAAMGYQCFADDPAKFRKPDVSVVRAGRMTDIDPQTGFLHSPPDLTVEVLSPNDLVYDVTTKIDEYLKNGFPLIWVVHPNVRAVAVYRADGTTLMLHEGDEITGEPALPGFRCKVAEFFAK